MKRQTLFTVTLAVMAVMVLVGVSNARADGVVTTDAIARTWYRNIHFSDHYDVERIQFL